MLKLKIIIKKIYHILKQDGADALVAKVIKNAQQLDVIGFYDYIIDNSLIHLNKEDVEKYQIEDNKIILNWIVPEMGIGSGGHINIFRFVSYLQRKGHINRIYLFNSTRFKSNEQVKKFLMEHYPTLDSTVEVYCDTSQIQFAHATLATSWHTAYFVKRFNNTLQKFYFVQDFEPFFYAHGSEYAFAEATYKFGFIGITAGGWLKEKLSKEYQMNCYDFGFSYDKHLYKPIEKRDNIKRILFYARPVTPRRSFEIGLLAINELHKKMPEVGVIFAGWDVSNYEIPFPHLNAGSVALDGLPDLYSQCDICLALSNTNLSLLPLEVMACNSVIMSNNDDHVRWLLNEDNSILSNLDPNDIADKLYYYLNNEDELDKIRGNGYKCAINTSWDNEGKKVEEYILEEINNNVK
ncbi:rhamnosyltransferase WsaF family glycosyltransferase [Clostridium beijerinckii]|uniref:Glycosyltransferase family 4 protein n=1 Tax=Clostridium beijerinckii TaxID=1520 RepID=A0A7X9XNI3_CLOBE|nr:glycosyltransferase [Clostridium beijerinckii]NMF04278.1 glycosyltransferase family 4 protein [Clostridium beijerinckii]